MLRRSIRRLAVLVSMITLLYAFVFFIVNRSAGGQYTQKDSHIGVETRVKIVEYQTQEPEIESQRVKGLYLPYGITNYPVIIDNNFIAPNRIFHLDLKGAAPKVDYILKLIPFMKHIGATGILIEYEDMFPFKGNLRNVKAHNAYTEEEVLKILQHIATHKLDIIPLVQTVGHLEYVLKYRNYSKFRQEERYPQVICLADDKAVALVQEILTQVLDLHQKVGISFVHIGADEVFQVGRCAKDREYMVKKNVDAEYLLLRHISRMAKFIKKRIADVNVMIWHDMLTNVHTQLLEHFKQVFMALLGELVEPVVWNYAENLEESLFPDFWQRLSTIFPCIWAASAFKGADGPDQFASNVPHYLANHVSWIKQMNDNHSKFKQFRGVIVTGWQRYDHFAILCEVLPVGLLSAAVNFAVLKNGKYNSAVLRSVSEMLKCSSQLYINKDLIGYFPRCEFPGVNVFNVVQSLKTTLTSIDEQIFNDYQVRGWMSEFNGQHSYSQVWYLDQAVYKVRSYIREMENLENGIRLEMMSVFRNDTISEFIYVYVKPTLRRLENLSARIDKLSELREFPRRPFELQEL